MHISRVKIRNFRNFKNAEFRFAKGVNTLIGENGSGKTNAFYAIRLLLDDSLPRRASSLRESDFNRANGAWRGHWVIISLDFAELDASEGCQMIRHSVGHMHPANIGTYSLVFRPNRGVRRRLFELSRDGFDDADIQNEIDSITLEQYETVFTGRATAEFTNDDHYCRLAGDFEDLSFPDPEDEDADFFGVPTPTLHNEVSCTFVKALRDVVVDLRSYRDSPLLSLLRGTEREIELGDASRIIQQIATLNNDISSLTEIRQISEDIQNTLHDTVGHTYSPSIDIRSAVPEEIDRLLQGLALKVSDPSDEGYQGDLYELSLGGANLIYLALKLLEYETKLASDRVAHFLLIEEPEAHIHTHIQKTLFDKYGHRRTQVIVSTHSTHISAASRIRSVNILAKCNQEAQVFHPSNGLDDGICMRIERYLDAVRSTLLFAKGVILVEGDAEMIVIPTLVKKVFGISLDELGISLINMSAAVFSNLAIMFDEQRVARRCAIITDLDESIVDLPESADDDDDFQGHCRNSQEVGERRRDQLNDTYGNNDWVVAFYARYTFEVDFLLAKNSDVVVATLDSVFQQQAARDRSSTRLKDDDVAVAGREILRLTDSTGKGWLALLMAEQVHIDSIIPDYILEAVAFACGETVDQESLRVMAKYRLADYKKGGVDVDAVIAVALNGTIDELIDAYVERLPEDVLTSLIQFLGPDDG